MLSTVLRLQFWLLKYHVKPSSPQGQTSNYHQHDESMDDAGFSATNRVYPLAASFRGNFHGHLQMLGLDSGPSDNNPSSPLDSEQRNKGTKEQKNEFGEKGWPAACPLAIVTHSHSVHNGIFPEQASGVLYINTYKFTASRQHQLISYRQPQS